MNGFEHQYNDMEFLNLPFYTPIYRDYSAGLPMFVAYEDDFTLIPSQPVFTPMAFVPMMDFEPIWDDRNEKPKGDLLHLQSQEKHENSESTDKSLVNSEKQ